MSAQTETWNGNADFDLQVSRIINQIVHPFVISDGNIICGLMPLNSRLSPNTSWIFVSQPDQIVIPKEFSDVFLYNASDTLRSQLEKRYNFKPVYHYSYPGSFIWKAPLPSILWKLETFQKY